MIKWNLGAIAVFMRLGFFVGDETAWTGVRPTPPVGITSDALESLWNEPEDADDLAGLSRAQLISRYLDLFSQSVQSRATTEPFVLPLSGGADSRHILLELCRQGCSPQTTLTVRRLRFVDPDVRAAGLVSTHVGITHEVVGAISWTHRDEIAKNKLTSFEADEHGWVGPLAEALKRRTKSTYDGIGGDVLSAGLFLNPERLALKDDPQGFAESLMKGEDTLRSLLSREFYELIPRADAVKRVAQEFLRHRNEPNPIGAFFFRNRTRREISQIPFALLQPLDVRAPYLAPELVRFLRGVPDGELVGKSLHREAIETAFPDVQVPYAKELASPPMAREANLIQSKAPALRKALSISSPLIAGRPQLAKILSRKSVAHQKWTSRLVWLASLGEFTGA
jgi:asparagine synthase (glutamine-hydrolysing)